MRRFKLETSTALLSAATLFSLASGAQASEDSLLNFSGFTSKNPQAALKVILNESALKSFLSKPGSSIELKKEIKNHGFRTIKTQAYLNGLEIIGAQAFHHSTPAGSFVSNQIPSFDLETKPTLSRAEAEAIARGVTIGKTNLVGRASLKILPSEENGSARLSYWVKVENQGVMDRDDVVIDAHTGELIFKSSRHISIAPVHVLSATPQCQKLDSSGDLMDIDPALCPPMIRNGQPLRHADDSALRAASNSNKVLNYFKSRHGRDSFDGRGSALVSIVHVGRDFVNAFWSPDLKVMGYGDGDGVEFKDFTFGVDVAGHEMTHGVVSSTADLLGFGQAGALNEAISDFFGKMIAQDGHWVLGRDLFIDQNRPDAGLRDMENPRSLMTGDFKVAADGTRVPIPYPAHWNERFTTAPGEACRDDLNDSCWVHINATIPGHAFYRMVQAIGEARAEKIVYISLTQFLSPRSKFIDQRNAAVQVCRNLFDAGTCSKVAKAWDDVGVM